MKISITRFIDKYKCSNFFFIALFTLIFTGVSGGCSVSFPDGKIACNSTDDCPGGLFCVSNLCYKNPVTDGSAMSFDASGLDGDGTSYVGQGGSAGASGAGGNCTPAVTKCAEGQCGTITDGCSGTITCFTKCAAEYFCENNRCILSDGGCPGCNIEGYCYETGSFNPKNSCETCSPKINPSAWSPTDGAPCNDNVFCKASDKCVGNRCIGSASAIDCNDNCKCTDDSCSEDAYGCVNISNCGPKAFCDCKTQQCATICPDNGCIINNACHVNGSRNLTNECQECDVSKNKNAWSVRAGEACSNGSSNECAKNSCDNSGKCVTSFENAGARCGDGSDTECTNPDTCDSTGHCNPNNAGTNVKCGITTGVCNPQSYCDGNGACNDAPNTGLLCQAATACSFAGLCDSTGKCSAIPYGLGTTCDNHSIGECENHSTCDGNGTCIPGNFKNPGTLCGQQPSDKCLAMQCNENHACVQVPLSGNSCGETKDCSAKQCKSGACVDVSTNEGNVCSQTNDKCTTKYCQNGSCSLANASVVCQDDDNKCKLKSFCNGEGVCQNKYQSESYVCGTGSGCLKEYTCDKVGICNANYYLPAEKHVCQPPGGYGGRNNPCQVNYCGTNGACDQSENMGPDTPCNNGKGCCNGKGSCNTSTPCSAIGGAGGSSGYGGSDLPPTPRQ